MTGHVRASAGRLFRLLILPGLLALGPARASIEPELAYFRHYGVAEGLSQNSVTAIHQDRNGFLWIGTQDGLNRFDGYDFLVFRRDIDDPASLSSSDIADLFEDGAGRLWVGTFSGGLNILDPATERIRRISIDGALSADDHVIAMCALSDDLVWIGTNSGILRVTGFGGGEVRAAPAALDPGPLADAEIADLACTESGHVWVATRHDGLYRLAPGDDGIRRLSLPAVAGVDSRRLAAIEATPEGDIWVGANGAALYRVDASGAARGWPVPADDGDGMRLRDLLVDDSGSLWLTGLGTGLLRFDPANERFVDFDRTGDRAAGLSDSDTYSLHLDRSGVLWIGTLSGGLNNLGLFSGGFERFHAGVGNRGGLSHNMVTSFAEQDGRIWIGTDGGGLNRFDPVTRSFEVFRHDPARTGSIADDRVWALLADRTGTLWVGTWGGGLMRTTDGSESFERLPGSPRNITALAEDRNGDLWVGTPGWGLYRRQGSGDPLTAVEAGFGDGSTLEVASIPDLHAGADGSLWIATWGDGLIRLQDGERPARWRHVPGDESSIASNTIRSITEAGDGHFWLGTASGLTQFDPRTGSVIANFSVEAGLPPSVIYAAVPDELGRVWVSSNRGIARFDVETGTARRYDPRDGLQGFEFNGAAALAGSDGYIYFGGTNGFNRFLPGSLRDNPFPPAVALTDFLLFNELQRPGSDSVLERALSATDAIVLEHTENVIALQFAALHFVSPERNRYAYRLEGFDRDWIHTDAERRVAAYTNLDPGEYRFRVKASNSDGVWSDSEASVRLEVLAPWWATRPAMLAYVIATVLLVSLFVRWRTLMLRHRAAELKKMVRDRTRLISEQKDTIAAQAEKVEQVLKSKEQLFARVSHEFRTPLTLILGSLGRLQDPGGNAADRSVSTIETSSRRLLRLVDQLLGLASLSKPRAGERHPRALHASLSVAVNSFESLAESRGIELSAGNIDEAWVRAAPEELDQVVLNLLSNAIKFTPEGRRVSVSLATVDGSARLSVVDTGIGIEPELQQRIFEPFEHGSVAGSGSGIGLTLVKEIVSSLGGEITLESSVGAGSRFDVVLPTCEAPATTTAEPAAASLERADGEAGHALQATGGASLAESGTTAAEDDEDRETVLVVEDNPELRTFLVETLGEQLRVAAAPGGREALQLAREDLPDIIVSDVMMPGMDGFEFCRAIKTDERTCHIPVILLTAREDRESMLQGLEEGADQYLTKPFDATALKLQVRNLLETRQMLRARLAATLDGAAVPSRRGPAETAGQGSLGRRDREFLKRLTEYLDRHHAETELGIGDIASAMAMSERQLQRKLKALLNRTPAEHLRIYRLHRAAELIRQGYPAASAAADTGFSSPSHFGACFKALFNMTPGEYGRARNSGNPG